MSLLQPLTSAELLHGIALDHDGDVPTSAAAIWLDPPAGRRVRAVFPHPVDTGGEHRVARYVASEANNLAVTRGGGRLHVTCPPELPPAKVLESIERHYPQVYQLLSSPAPVTASAETPTWAGLISPDPDTPEIPHLPPEKLAIGINVGQTDTKVVVTNRVGIRDGMRWRTPTFPETPTDHGLAKRVSDLTEMALAAAGGPVEHVGLAMGGIVRAGAINRHSGVALGLDDVEYEALAALPLTLRKRFGVAVSLVQDVEAKAHFHAVSGDLRDCLVLDLGTSLGGAYIDANGALPAYLNQVGRIAFDLDESSVPRADGQGDGLLSQYLSARGIVRLATAAESAITDAVQLENLPASPAHPDEQHFLRLLRSRLRSGVSLAAHWYDPGRIILTGGVVSGRFGAVAQTWLESSGGYEIAVSDEPLFDGCVGAAWIGLTAAAS